MASNVVNEEYMTKLDNNSIPQGWEIDNTQEVDNSSTSNISMPEIPQGWEIESYGDNIQQNTVEQPQIRETYLSQSPEKNIINNFMGFLKQVNNIRLSAFQEGKNTTRISDLEVKEMFGNISDEEKKELNALSNFAPIDYGVEDSNNFKKKEFTDFTLSKFVDKNFAKKGYINALKTLPMIIETTKAGGAGGAVSALVGAGVTGTAGVITKNPNIISAIPQVARQSFNWGARITGATKVAQLETGLARSEIKKINQEIIEKGGEPLSDTEINILAIGTGAFNGSLEVVSLEKILKTLPAGKEIIDYLKLKG